MAVEIEIKQKGFFKKSISLSTIQALLKHNMILGERDSNSSYVFNELQNDNINGVNLVVKNPDHLGRGFIINTNDKKLYTSLNVPTTDKDVQDFFDFIQKVCSYFKVNLCTMDKETQVKLEDLDSLRQEISLWNKNYLAQYIEEIYQNEATFIVFALHNPIYVPMNILESWTKLSTDELERVFAEYLYDKQSEDIYYMKPTFYQKNQDILGAYTLTETVDSIVAKQAFVPPITSGLPEGIEPNIWNLGIVRFPDNAEPTIDHIPYNTFLEKIKVLNLEEYDQKHWILRNPSKSFLERLLE